jgi:hypothetical protein
MPTPREALSAALDRWNAGDLDGYLSLYDEGIRLHGYSPEPMDKAQVRGFYQGIFRAFDTPKLEFNEVLWDGDACTIRFTMTGRHVDEFMGVPADETPIAGRHPDHSYTRASSLARESRPRGPRLRAAVCQRLRSKPGWRDASARAASQARSPSL